MDSTTNRSANSKNDVILMTAANISFNREGEILWIRTLFLSSAFYMNTTFEKFSLIHVL
jgi:hypothetical protein